MECPAKSHAIDALGADVQGEQRRLRELGGVTCVELPGRVRAWSVNTFALARKVFADPRFAKDPRKHWTAYLAGEIPEDWLLISWIKMDSMAIADGEHHRRLRGLIGKSFTPRRVEEKRPLIETVVADLLDGLAAAPAGEPVDLKRFAYQVAAQTICELFGVPSEDRAEVLHGGAVAVDTTVTPEEAAAGMMAWQNALGKLVSTKRASLAEDMVSDLIRARDESGLVNDSELIGSLFMALGAGTETVVNLLSTAVRSLLTHPEQLAWVRSGKASWDDVIDETLRHEPPLSLLPLRYATEDVELDGVTIRQGDAVLIALAAAARDPELHGPTAEDFDIMRESKEHLTFGYGAHYCLGQPLARLEAAIALPALFQRFPDMALAVRPEELRSQGSFIMNGNAELPVFLEPTPA